MNVIITSFFTNNNVPATTLTPSIRIWLVDPQVQETLIVGAPNGTGANTDGTMEPVSDGISNDGGYKFTFNDVIGFDVNQTYMYRVDGGSSLPPGERFQGGTITPSDHAGTADISSAVWNETLSSHTGTGSTGLALNQIKANVDNLTLTTIDSNELIKLLLKYETNRTRIDKTNKTLIVYDDDCTTELRVFQLKDSNNNPNIEEVCERVPISATDGLDVCTP